MPDFNTRRIVEPSDPPKPVEPITAEGLLKEMHELIDMLPEDMLEKAAEGILSVPDFPEDFDPNEIERFEMAKRDFRNGSIAGMQEAETKTGSIRETNAEYTNHLHATRKNLHRLAEYMSCELLDEAVDVLKSTALLDIPIEPTEEEIRILRETDEEFERGEFFTWEEIKRTDV